MSKVKEFREALVSLSDEDQKYIRALVLAASDKKMSATDAQEFTRLFHGRPDMRNWRKLIQFLISRGYLQDG